MPGPVVQRPNLVTQHQIDRRTQVSLPRLELFLGPLSCAVFQKSATSGLFWKTGPQSNLIKIQKCSLLLSHQIRPLFRCFPALFRCFRLRFARRQGPQRGSATVPTSSTPREPQKPDSGRCLLRAPSGRQQGAMPLRGAPAKLLVLQWWAYSGSAEPEYANLGQSGGPRCRFKGESV